MTHVLIKYRGLKLLVHIAHDTNRLLPHLPAIKAHADRYKELLDRFGRVQIYDNSEEEAAAMDAWREGLDHVWHQIGYHIVGFPFDKKDARMYALNRGLAYEELELLDD